MPPAPGGMGPVLAHRRRIAARFSRPLNPVNHSANFTLAASDGSGQPPALIIERSRGLRAFVDAAVRIYAYNLDKA